MLKIRYQTPRGAVGETVIDEPEKKLDEIAMRAHIRRELVKKGIEYKNKPQIVK